MFSKFNSEFISFYSSFKNQKFYNNTNENLFNAFICSLLKKIIPANTECLLTLKDLYNKLIEILQKYLGYLINGNEIDRGSYIEKLKISTNLLRLLRNFCACHEFYRDSLVQNESFFKDLANSLKSIYFNTDKLLPILKETEYTYIRCLVQLVGNSLCRTKWNYTNNDTSRNDDLFMVLFLNDFIEILLLENNDAKLKTYICMNLYNHLHESKTYFDFMISHLDLFPAIIEVLLDLITEPNIDCIWSFLLIEEYSTVEDFFKNIWQDLHIRKRIGLLYLLSDTLENAKRTDIVGENMDSISSDKYHYNLIIHVSNLKFIINDFIQIEDSNFKLVELKISEEIVFSELNFITICSMYRDAFTITSNVSLLIKKSIYYLKLLNENKARQLIKSNKNTNMPNQMSTINKISEETALLNSSEPQSIFTSCSKSTVDISLLKAESNFKKNLVRLIGNLSFENAKNQNLINEIGGIPLLLDLTTIDDHCMFLQQWAIFAIHNLCHKNPDIQKIISQTEYKQVIDEKKLIGYI